MTAHASQLVETTPDRVFEVLSDGWMYAAWVVGASHVRAVDDDWPAVGAKIHHSVGLWPGVVRDTSQVTRCEPDRRLVLDVAVWFLGRGTVDLELHARPGDRTEVVMREEMHHGLLAKFPAGVVDPVISRRNIETLGRLAAIAERRPDPLT